MMSLMNLSMTEYRLEEQCHKGVDKRSDVTDEPGTMSHKVRVRGVMSLMNLSMTRCRLEEQCCKGAGKRSDVTSKPL